MIGWVFSWLLLGCGGGSALENCPDVACKSAIVIAAWDADPQEARGLIDGFEMEMEQVAVVNALVQARGEPAAGLCEVLASNPHGQRCHRIASRPHLRHEAGGVGVAPVGGGAPGACEAGLAGRACRALEAAGAARRGDLEKVRQSCLAEEAGQWRQECHFQAAEAWMAAHGAKQIPDATVLCAAAGEYRSECLRHVVLSVVRGSPGMAWKSAESDARAIGSAFESVDAALGRELVDRYWAEMLANAWAGPRAGEGSPPVLPELALPHHRAGAAMRWMRDGARPETLEAAVIELGEWMRRTGLPVHRLGEPFPRVEDAWPGETGATTVSYLGASRRLVASTANEDLEICILEAAARTGAQKSLLELGLIRPSSEVQQTARRLLSLPLP